MTNITKEQLKIIIKETIKISKEDSFLKVIYDDKWKEDKKLAEKVNKTGIDTNDIVCVISELFDMVIFKKNTIWLSSSKKEYDYSNLLLAYSVYDKKIIV